MSKVRAQKRQLEKARQEKQAAKRERRHSREGDGAVAATEERPVEYPQDAVLADLAELHRRFGDGGMALEEFEDARATLVQRLRVD